MKRVGLTLVMVAAFGAAVGCSDMTPRQQDTTLGAGAGAAAGAGIAAIAGGSGWTGAAIGAVAGGVIGNIVGKDKQQSQ
jgi:osmotically inducible lipoprotein OsmB